MSDFDTIEFNVDEGVATITVDRPESRNALNVPTIQSLRTAVTDAASQDARVLVI